MENKYKELTEKGIASIHSMAVNGVILDKDKYDLAQSQHLISTLALLAIVEELQGIRTELESMRLKE